MNLADRFGRMVMDGQAIFSILFDWMAAAVVHQECQ